MEEKLLQYAESCQEELQALLKTLCAIPAPSNQEEARTAFCLEWMHKHGMPEAYADSVGNVIWRTDDRQEGLTLLLAHTDTVFPDLEPMPQREENGRLYCPGVGDDTSNLAVLLLCARFVSTLPQRPAGLVFCANAAEEGLGNLRGCRRLMEDFAGQVKQVIALDDSIGCVVNGAVGSVRWRVTARTAGGHSFGDFGAENAIVHLAQLVCALQGQPLPEGCGKTTFNVGQISGGTSVNTIAQQAEMLYEYRSETAAGLEQMEGQFQRIVAGCRGLGMDLTLEELGRRPGMGPVPRDAQQALEAQVCGIIQAVTGTPPVLSAGSTDCNIPYSLGIPAICTGAYIGAGGHTREEWVELQSLRQGMEIVLRIVMAQQ